MRTLRNGVLAALLCTPSVSKADLWGADLPFLIEIALNTASQLVQLIQIVEQSQDTLNLMRDINAGVSDALEFVEVLKNNPGSSLYRELSTLEAALRKVESTYGKAPETNLAEEQRNTDQSIAESFVHLNSMNDVMNSLGSAGRSIQSQSRISSPKGAAKLTAQGVGVLVEAMNESIRTETSSLTLQAQTLANANRQEKEETRQMKETSDALAQLLKQHEAKFKAPEF